jgi:hypothetical protein
MRGYTIPSRWGLPPFTVASNASASVPSPSYLRKPAFICSSSASSSEPNAVAFSESNRNVDCQFVKVVIVMNPWSIPRRHMGEPLAFDALPLREVGASVRTMSPQSGSSVSIRSKMYSMLRGFVDLALVAGGGANSQDDDDDADGVGSSLLRLAASLHSSVISAMESVRCLRSVTTDKVEPERSREHHGTSRKLYDGCLRGSPVKRRASNAMDGCYGSRRRCLASGSG